MKDGKCSATNKDGRPCSAQAWRDGLCRWHHPDLEAQRAEGRRKGGQARSSVQRARKALAGDVRDLAGVKAKLMAALGKVEAGELEPGPANAMAALGRAICTVHEAVAIEDLARRLDELERLASKRGLA